MKILTNVARHARATHVEVLLQRAGGFVQLEVSDNGRGISEREKAGVKSLGLLGMRERAHILGGQVEIHGTPGRGTTVTVKIPLPESGGKSPEPGRPTQSGDSKNLPHRKN